MRPKTEQFAGHRRLSGTSKSIAVSAETIAGQERNRILFS
jgi:hypothetical protein